MKKLIILMIFGIFSFASEEIFADFEVYAKQSSKLAFEGSGKVDKIFVDVSSHVKKGDVLAILDQSSLEIALKKAKNDLELAKNASEFAKNTLNKFTQVRDVTSKQEFDEVKYKFDEAALRVQAAEIAILNADDHLKKALLKAPFDGVIASKNIELGEGVSPLQPAFVLNSEEAKILITIDEKYANLVRVGDTFKFKLDAASDEKEVKIALIYPEIKRETRKFYAQAYSTSLKPGMFGQGKVIIGENK
ncbi:efflux RND transporter periplasmic adaptor subunit [Campylobacter concisus]|uniref:efflux RND transporter periplasmic adaptor subunit n=1 Tax=Campylobacter concisus TaxID=199 RepID=UPI00122D1C0B|nr:efflux RND transporter periplasmic adaptor subunit [Campylobacter concisus]